MDGWNTTFLLGRPIFRGYVSFREGIYIYIFFFWGEKKGKVLGLLAEVVIVLAVQTL